MIDMAAVLLTLIKGASPILLLYPLPSSIALFAAFLILHRLIKSALAIESPSARAHQLILIWDISWAILALVGVVTWIGVTPNSEGNGLFLLLGLPLMLVFGFPLYLLFAHCVFVLGLYLWAKWRDPEMISGMNTSTRPIFIFSALVFCLFLLTLFAIKTPAFVRTANRIFFWR